MADSVDDTLRRHLEEIRADLHDLRDVIQGRPDVGWQGVMARIEMSERQIHHLTEVQDSFLRDREREQEKRALEQATAEKREAFRVRVQVAVLSTFGALLVTIFAAVLKLLTDVPGVAG